MPATPTLSPTTPLKRDRPYPNRATLSPQGRHSSPMALRIIESDHTPEGVFDKASDYAPSPPMADEADAQMSEGEDELDMKPSLADYADDSSSGTAEQKSGLGGGGTRRNGAKGAKGENKLQNGGRPKVVKKGREAWMADRKTKGTPYTAEEDWILFQALYPKSTPVWAKVAAEVNRDVKSCQNRAAVVTRKVEGAIKGISSGA